MNNMDLNERFAKNWLFLFSNAFILAVGGFVTLFFVIYSRVKINPEIIGSYYQALLFLAGFATLIITPVGILYQSNVEKLTRFEWAIKLRPTFYGFSVLILFMYGFYLFNKAGINIKIVELAAAGYGIYLFYRFQDALVKDGLPAWRHPTTATNIMAGLAKTGISALIWVFRGPEMQNLIANMILTVLLLEILIIYARFKFLTKRSAETYQTARIMMMQHNFLFALRIIIGLFIPLIYVAYHFLGKIESFYFIGMFLVLGELLERFLFVYTAVPVMPVDPASSESLR
ncbi:MAG: hypothetical protein AB7W47_07260 [Calditrichaceae bacterium]